MKKKVVKIKESDLNNIIKKVISEQEGQVMTTGPSPEQVTGTPETGGEDLADSEPNFGQFISCAKELIDQGVTIGTLVDQLLDAKDEEPETGLEDGPVAGTEDGIEPEAPMA